MLSGFQVPIRNVLVTRRISARFIFAFYSIFRGYIYIGYFTGGVLWGYWWERGRSVGNIAAYAAPVTRDGTEVGRYYYCVLDTGDWFVCYSRQWSWYYLQYLFFCISLVIIFPTRHRIYPSFHWSLFIGYSYTFQYPRIFLLVLNSHLDLCTPHCLGNIAQLNHGKISK